MSSDSAAVEQRYAGVVAAGRRLLVALDFDGTLAPIVADPARARIHPHAGEVLTRLAGRVAAVAIVTGRPVRQVLELGRFDELVGGAGPADGAAPGDEDGRAGGAAPSAGGRRLIVAGQYGNEHWDSRTREIRRSPPPEGLARLREELPDLLAAAGCADAWVEDKRLALAVHTRRLADAEGSFRRLLPPLTEAAHRHGLAVEPGRMVIELRGPGTDKGHAVRGLVDELGARAIVFAGDDLGDVAAFRAVADLREHGVPGLLVCSGSEEQTALAELADVVVDGPAGTLAFLADLATDLVAS